jgi:hypothetical protein
MPLSALVPWRNKPKLCRRDLEQKATGKTWSLLLRLKTPTGNRPALMARASPLVPRTGTRAGYGPSGLEAKTLAVHWTSLTLHKRHNLAYIDQRRRCRGFGRCAGVCWAMSVANRNRSSMRKCERPADIRTNGSGGARLVHAVGRYRSLPPSSRKQTRSSPQARYWSMGRSSRP